MAGKGRQYWLDVWRSCNYPAGHKGNPHDSSNRNLLRASERLLKRYGYLWTFTTYGKEVNSV